MIKNMHPVLMTFAIPLKEVASVFSVSISSSDGGRATSLYICILSPQITANKRVVQDYDLRE